MTFDEQEEEERIDQLFNYLVEEGALELISIDPTSQEPLYRITPKCQEILPELYEEFQSETNETIFDLWQLGIVDMMFGDSNQEDKIKLSQGWQSIFEEKQKELTSSHKNLVYNLIDDAIIIEALTKLYEEEL